MSVEGEVDRISKLPDSILLHIMTFITTKEAVQTCILSKRWKDLWKCLSTLSASSIHFQMNLIFKNFIQNFLLYRDDYISLYNIDIQHRRYLHTQILGNLIQYAVSHGVEKLRVDVNIRGYIRKIHMFHHSIFSCHSLKYLDLSLHGSMGTIIFPATLNLPVLTNCHLKEVSFSSSDNECAKPFLSCQKLSVLVIEDCTLYNAHILSISSDKLSNLALRFGILTYSYNPGNVQIFAPNLKSFAYVGHLTSYNIPPQFEHNLDFLEEVSIEVMGYENSSKTAETFKKWLKRFSNINSLTLSLGALEVLTFLPNFPNIEPIRFGNLMSLTVKKLPATLIPNEVLKYLLQDSLHVEPTIKEVMTFINW